MTSSENVGLRHRTESTSKPVPTFPGSKWLPLFKPTFKDNNFFIHQGWIEPLKSCLHASWGTKKHNTKQAGELLAQCVNGFITEQVALLMSGDNSEPTLGMK
jgi:hypothetical protein